MVSFLWDTSLLQQEWVKGRWWGKSLKKNIVENVPTKDSWPNPCSSILINTNVLCNFLEPIWQNPATKNMATLHFLPIDTPMSLVSCNSVHLLLWTIHTRQTTIISPSLPLFFLATILTPQQIFLATFFSHLRYNHHHINAHNTQQFTTNTPTQH